MIECYMNKQRTCIDKILNGIAIDKGVRLLYACGGGSREWGFASEHSDYDVYFLYAYPKNAYLCLDTPQDTIERKIITEEATFGIAGWDIFKALRLLRKSNPPLLEQLFSTTIYAENTPQIDVLRDIARRTYSSSAVFYHYSRMASRNYRQYIANKLLAGDAEVHLKKYLYVVRPMIALFFVEQHKTLPPTNFLKTLKNIEIDEDVREAILDLVDRKKIGQQLGMGAPIPALNAFAEQYLTKWMEYDPEKDSKRHDFIELDNIILSILEEANNA